MIYFTEDESQMLKHTAEVMDYRMRGDDGYTDEEQDTVDKIDAVGDMTKTGTVLVIGREEIPGSEARDLLHRVVAAEIANWVDNSSQRLIRRASAVLGFDPGPVPVAKDHGPNPGNHALVPDWVAGHYGQRCATCGRLFAI